MTSEHRRYERLLKRQSRGLPLRPEELAQLASAEQTLAVAQNEHALLGSLKQWFEAPPSVAEKHSLARLERAAVVRSRHSSRASLRLLLSEDSTTAAQPLHGAARLTQPLQSLVQFVRAGAWTRVSRKWGIGLGCVLASAGALAFGSEHWALVHQPLLPSAAQTTVSGAPLQVQPLEHPAQLPPAVNHTDTRATEGGPTVDSLSSSPPTRRSSAGGVHAAHLSANDLLVQAREALRERNAKRALARYRELVRRFPTSSEAASVKVTIAQLELQSGSSKAALAGFEGYLRQGGSLGPEALAGKVQALNALGRPGQAKQAMREYLARFPNEVHSKGYRRALEQ